MWQAQPQQQQQTKQTKQWCVVKVMAHSQACAFMLEQVAEVWTRLAHPHVVACLAADTVLASDAARTPHVVRCLHAHV